MPAFVPNKETLEHGVLDFAWRCGQKAKGRCKDHRLIPWIRVDKLLAAFTQGWFGERLEVPDFLLEQGEVQDLPKCGSPVSVLERACKRARKYSGVGGIRA